MYSRSLSNRRAASLVELLTALVIFGILLALSVSLVASGIRFAWNLESQANWAKRQIARRSQSNPPSSKGHLIPGQYIIILKDGADVPQTIQRLSQQVSLRVLCTFSNCFAGFAVQTSASSLQVLLNDPDIRYIEQDQTLVLASLPQTPRVDLAALALRRLNLPTTLPVSMIDVDMAILDTGVDLSSDSVSVVMRKGFGYADDAKDTHGHGTQVAGVAAGWNGVAPGARVWALKVADDEGGTASNLVAALDYVYAHGDEIDVANISVCTSSRSQAVNTAAARCVSAGVVVVAAAGNGGRDASNFSPGGEPSVITVAALTDTDGKLGGKGELTLAGDADDTLASFSNYGPAIDLLAPGVQIETSELYGQRRRASGTSVAAAHVSGLAALLRHGSGKRSTFLTPDAVAAQLQTLATERIPGRGRLTPYPVANSGLSPSSVNAGPPASSARPLRHIPVSFEQNHGQTHPDVKYLARVKGGVAFLTERGVVLASKSAPPQRIEFANANRPAIAGRRQFPGMANYFIGNNRSRWLANIPTFPEVLYNEVYPGIDVVFHSEERNLRYDIIVAPGADPANVTLSFPDALGVQVDRTGTLRISRPGYTADLAQSAPIIFQHGTSGRQAVRGRYVAVGPKQVRFEIGPYDRNRELIIDPIVSSTYLGGTAADEAYAATSDAAGNIYLAGITNSPNYPLAGALDGTLNATDAFVTKVNPTGTTLLYSTYLGGSSNEGGIYALPFGLGHAITVDAAGNAYVSNATTSTDFPTVNPAQAIYGGGTDAFLAKLNAAGNALLFSTFLGANTYEEGRGLALDAGGNAYLVGLVVNAGPFPTTPGAWQTTYAGGPADGYVAKYTSAGARVYSTLIGGTGDDQVGAVTIVGSDAYITGGTSSTDFPIAGSPVQPANGGTYDGFVSRLNAAGDALVFSTYLGGNASDFGRSIAVDAAGNIFVGSEAGSANFPTTPGAAQTIFGGGARDAAVTKLDPTASTMLYSTLIGGSGSDVLTAITIDAAGNAYATGQTSSANFPQIAGLQTFAGNDDAFVSAVNAAGSALTFSSYLGGNGADRGFGIMRRANGELVVVGWTDSTNFPLTAPLQVVYGGGTADAFITRLTTTAATAAVNIATGSTNVSEAGGTATYTIVLNSQPTANVTVNLNPGTQLTATPASVTFTPTNWNVPQTIIVGAVDDSLVEGPHTGTVNHTAVSTDPSYNGVAIVSVTANITDNDSLPPGTLYGLTWGTPTLITINTTTGVGTTVGPVATQSPVGLSFSGNRLYTTGLSANIREINPFTGAVIASTVVPGLPTFSSEGDLAFRSDGIGFLDNSGLHRFDLSGPSGTAISPTVNMDGLAFNSAGVLYGLSEGGGQLSTISQTTGQAFPVGPTGIPAGNNLGGLAFDAVDNLYAAVSRAGGPSSLYRLDAATGTATLIGNIGFNEVSGISFSPGAPAAFGVTITPSGGSTAVTEGGATDTFTMALATAPTADVTITINPGTQLTTTPATVTFTPTNWNTPQTVTVTAVDDTAVEGLHSGTITYTAASADTNYNNIAIVTTTVSITDNDSGGPQLLYGITVNEELITINPATGAGTLVGRLSSTMNSMGIAFRGNKLYAADNIANRIQELNPATAATLNTINVGIASGGGGDIAFRGDGIGFLADITTNGRLFQFDITVPNSSPITGTLSPNMVGLAFNSSGVLYGLRQFGGQLYTIDQATGATTLVGNTGIPALTFGGLTIDAAGNMYASLGPQTGNSSLYRIDASTGAGTLVGDIGFNGVSGLAIGMPSSFTAGVNINQSGGSTDVTEGGATDAYTVMLNSAPAANVTITLNPGSQVTVAPTTLTFTPANWNTAQTVTVTAVDDTAVEGAHTGTISHTATSADAVYNGIAIASVTVNITDNDTATPAGVTITQSGGSTAVTEGGAADTYTVVLNTAPTANVTIVLNGGTQLTVAPATLTFTPANWNTPQTVTVTAVDDTTVEGAHTGTIGHGAASADPGYAGIAIPNVTVNITDNDSGVSPGVTITQSFGSTTVSETGVTDTYAVQLNTAPTANVTIALNPGTQVTVAPTSLTFTPANWFIAQTVTVTAVDDTAVEGAHTGTIAHTATSTDTNYDGISISSLTVNITDNDAPGSPGYNVGFNAGHYVVEGGITDTYTIRLLSIPTADVTITVGASTQVTTSPTVLVFTPANWNRDQTVTITAIDDALLEGLHKTTLVHSTSSADPNYDRDNFNIVVTIEDNDAPGPGPIIITPSGGSTNVTEGGATDTYTVVLASAPTAIVFVTATGTAQALGSAPLQFTPANWNIPQTITVTATDDVLIEGPHSTTIMNTSTSFDPVFTNWAMAVPVNITDNDFAPTAGVTITQSGGSTDVTEGGASDTYTVVLNTAPTANVVVTFNPGTQLSVGPPASLTFTPTNWNTPQTATVGANDDTLIEGPHTGTMGHNATSADPAYNGISIPSLTVNITDNDAAIGGVTITQSGGSTAVTEGGPTDTYTVVLTGLNPPTANVTVAINPGTQLSVAPTSLTFTPANWNTPQTVTVTAVDDTAVEGAHTGTISHTTTSTDTSFNAIAVPNITVNITDNDPSTPGGVTITQSGGGTSVAEGGGTDTYTVVLNTAPTANVTITLNPGTQVTVAPATLTFTPANWNTPQTVTVTAVDDTTVEAAHTGTIAHTAASTDAAYNGLAIPSVTVSITDNDPGPAGTMYAVSWGGGQLLTIDTATGAATVVGTLLQQPNGIAIRSGNLYVLDQFNARIRQINPANGATIASIDVGLTGITGEGDMTFRGDGIGFIADIAPNRLYRFDIVAQTSTLVGQMPVGFHGLAFSPTGVLYGLSDPGNDLYRIDETTATATLIGPTGITGQTGGLAFDGPSGRLLATMDPATNSDLYQIDPATGRATLIGSTGRPQVSGLTFGTATAATAGVTITQSGGSTAVTEGGATDTYTVVLTSPPTSVVNITLNPGTQVTVAPSVVSFNGTTWSTPQTVTVTAVDDTAVEGAHTGTISHTAVSTDSAYNAISIPSVTVNITDNDTALPGVTITQTGGSTAVTEGGAIDTYTVVLNAQPTANVIITANGGTQLFLAPGTLTFDTGNWNTPQTVTVTAVDDTVVEGAHIGTISHTVLSADPAYTGISISSITVNITDNDTAPPTQQTLYGIELQATIRLFTIDTATGAGTVVGAPSTGRYIGLGFRGSQLYAYDSSANRLRELNPATGAIVTTIDVGIPSAGEGDMTFRADGVGFLASFGSRDLYRFDVTTATSTLIGNIGIDIDGLAFNSAGVLYALRHGGQELYTIDTATAAPTLIGRTGMSGGTGGLAFDASGTLYAGIAAGNPSDLFRVNVATGTATLVGNITGMDGLAGLTFSSGTPQAGVTVTQTGGSTAVSEGGATDTYTIVLNSQPTANVSISTNVGTQVTLSGPITFTPANWNVPVTVTVTAVDDTLVEGPHTFTILHTATSTDSAYGGISIPSVTVNITDNDSVPAGVTITQTGGSTDVTEGGATDTYTVVLNSAPTAVVSVGLSAPGTQVTLNPPIALIFAPFNWSTPQTVTVTAVDDTAVEGPHTTTINHTSTSTDPAYNGLAISSVTVNITDNDTGGAPGVTVTQTGGTTAVTEGGATDTITVVLNSQPLGPVAFAANGGVQLTVSPTSHQFTPANWNIPITITVTAVDDTVVESSPHNGFIGLAVVSSFDPAYNFSIPTLTVQVTDNDSGGPGVTVTQSGGSTAVTEGGATDTYTVVLNSAPTANVAITLNPGTQLTVAPATLTFTPANWNTPQTVTVTAVDDTAVEGAHTGTISYTASSTDSNYSGLAIPSTTVNITDNDAAPPPTGGRLYGITFSGNQLITIDTATGAGTLVGPLSSNMSALGLGFRGNQLYAFDQLADQLRELNTATGATINSINIGAFFAEGDITFRGDGIGFLADTTGLSRFDITVPNSTPIGALSAFMDGLAFSPGGVLYGLSQVGSPSALYTINTTTGAVTLVGNTSITGAFNLGGLTFDGSGNLYAVAGGPTSNLYRIDVATGAATLIGPIGFAEVCGITFGSSAPTAGVTIAQSGGSTAVAEGGATDTYTVVLNTAPTANVTVTLNPGTQVTVAPTTLTFTPTNWNTPQTVTVTAVDDTTVEGPHTGTIGHTAASSDTNYSGITIAGTTVSITDNDLPPPTGGRLYGITIFSNELITIDTATGAGTLVGPLSSNMNAFGLDFRGPQLYALDQLADLLRELNPATGATINSINLGGGNFSAEGDIAFRGDGIGFMTSAQGFTRFDVTVPSSTNIAVTLNPLMDGLAFSPGGVLYGLAQAGSPSALYSIDTATGAATLVGNTGIAAGSFGVGGLTFDASGNLFAAYGSNSGSNLYRIDVATGVGTLIGPIGFNDVSGITFGSSAPTAGVTITQSGGSTAVAEGGATDTYTVVLNTAPTANVTITINPGTQITVAPTTLTFTPANWNTPQTVTVTAVDDAVAEGAHTGTITYTAVSADANYNAISISNVTVNITDNDTAGVSVTQSGGNTAVGEGGPTDTYTVVLNSAPTANVVITLNPGTQLATTPATLTFTPANWNTPQTVTVTAVDDTVVEGAHSGTITHTAASTDAGYNNITIGSVTVSITDNDVPRPPGVAVVQTGGATTAAEGGASDSYSIVLNTAPTANVTITLNGGTQVALAPAALTFTPTNWNVPQTVTVIAVDDTLIEGPHSATITHTATSADASYNNIAIGNVIVNIIENDVPPPDAADTSEKATPIGTLAGAMTFRDVDTFRHPGGLFDDDWYAVTMKNAGTFTVTLSNIRVKCSGPQEKSTFGDLHLRMYRVVNGNLIQIGASQDSGAKTVSAAVGRGERILVWFYGLYYTQARYDFTLDLK